MSEYKFMIFHNSDNADEAEAYAMSLRQQGYETKIYAPEKRIPQYRIGGRLKHTNQNAKKKEFEEDLFDTDAWIKKPTSLRDGFSADYSAAGVFTWETSTIVESPLKICSGSM